MSCIYTSPILRAFPQNSRILSAANVLRCNSLLRIHSLCTSQVTFQAQLDAKAYERHWKSFGNARFSLASLLCLSLRLIQRMMIYDKHKGHTITNACWITAMAFLFASRSCFVARACAIILPQTKSREKCTTAGRKKVSRACMRCISAHQQQHVHVKDLQLSWLPPALHLICMGLMPLLYHLSLHL